MNFWKPLEEKTTMAANAWILHVKKFQKKHPEKSWKESLKLARKTYKKAKKAPPRSSKAKAPPAKDE